MKYFSCALYKYAEFAKVFHMLRKSQNYLFVCVLLTEIINGEYIIVFPQPITTASKN